MDLDAIKKRREDFNNAMREQAAAVMGCHEYGDNCGSCSACEKAELAATEFWHNIEDDEAALIEEVERLRKARRTDQDTLHLITKMHASAAEMIDVLTKQLQEALAERARFYRCDDGDCMPGYAHEGRPIWHEEES